MKREMCSKKAKNSKIFRTAVSVLVCVVFIPLLVANGFLVVVKQGKLPYVLNANSAIVQTIPSLDKTTESAEDGTTDIEENAAGEEIEVITSEEETQGAVYNDSTEPCTQAQTEPVATTAPPTTTKPATTKPVATKPTTTKPPATNPATTKPATTAPAPTKPVAPPATTKPSTPSNAPCNHLDAEEQIMLDLVNQERRKAGVPEVKLDTNLRNVAQVKCREMIGLNYFSHQSPVYGSPFDMLKYFGIKYTKSGENLSFNSCVEAAHAALMNSQSHRNIMLNPAYTHVGIGAYEGVGTKYYTQIFVCYD